MSILERKLKSLCSNMCRRSDCPPVSPWSVARQHPCTSPCCCWRRAWTAEQSPASSSSSTEETPTLPYPSVIYQIILPKTDTRISLLTTLPAWCWRSAPLATTSMLITWSWKFLVRESLIGRHFVICQICL